MKSYYLTDLNGEECATYKSTRPSRGVPSHRLLLWMDGYNGAR